MYPPRLCLFAVLVAVGSVELVPAFAQEKKDPQSAFEPRSKPGEGQKFLARFVGVWSVTKTFRPRTGAPTVVQGECTQAMIHGGRFLQSDFVFGQGEARTTGMGLVGFESETGAFTSIWTDSRSTKVSLRRSKEKFNGEEIVLYNQGLTDAAKETRRSRTVTRLEDSDRKVIHRQYSIGADNEERLVMELVLTRKVEKK